MTLQTAEYLSTKSYQAKPDRQMFMDLALQPGVGRLTATEHQVTQRGAGANMSVDIAAGSAWLKSSSVSARNGLYHVYNDATVNVSITASNGTNPRIDSIYLQANDTADLSTATDNAAYVLVTGTPSSGATLANRTGAGAAPSAGAVLLLADILVPAASSSVINANIRDRRPWATGVWASGSRFAAISTNPGTSQTIIDSTNLSLRLECSGVPMLVSLHFVATLSTADYIATGLFVDGVPVYGGSAPQDIGVTGGAAAGLARQCGYSGCIVLPSAGSHLFQPTHRTTNGAATYSVQSNANAPVTFVVQELPYLTRNNGTS